MVEKHRTSTINRIYPQKRERVSIDELKASLKNIESEMYLKMLSPLIIESITEDYDDPKKIEKISSLCSDQGRNIKRLFDSTCSYQERHILTITVLEGIKSLKIYPEERIEEERKWISTNYGSGSMQKRSSKYSIGIHKSVGD